MSKADYSFFFPFRVRYSETDKQGIVFNAHYLTYFDTAIYEYCRTLPFDFQENLNQSGADFHTVHVDLDFQAPAGFDNEIEAHVKTIKMGRSSLKFEVAVYHKKGDAYLAKGSVVWVYVDQNTHRATALPKHLVERLEAREGINLRSPH